MNLAELRSTLHELGTATKDGNLLMAIVSIKPAIRRNGADARIDELNPLVFQTARTLLKQVAIDNPKYAERVNALRDSLPEYIPAVAK